MIKFILRATLLSAMLVAGTVIANADTTVQYTTLGCFGLGCVPAVTDTELLAGPGALQYSGQPITNINVPTGSFSGAQLGTFSWLGTPNAAFITPFTLQIVQTLPTGGSDVFTATVSGTVQSMAGINGSTTNVIFDFTSVTIGGITYTLTNLGGPGTVSASALLINPPGQITSVQSIVTAPVPEPASMLLLGTGLLGAAGAVRRRFKRN